MFSVGTDFEGIGRYMSMSAEKCLKRRYDNISAGRQLGNYDGGTISLNAGSGTHLILKFKNILLQLTKMIF